MTIEYKGIEYNSLTELCNKLNVNYNTFIKRRSRGYPLNECIKGRRKPVIYKGVNYRSYQELCDTFGVKLNTFNSRIADNWTVEESLNGKRENKTIKKNPVKFDGILYNNYKELCDKLGVDYKSFMQRRHVGFTLEECIYGKREKVIYEGIKYKSYAELCDSFGVSLNTFKYRRKKGLTLKECLLGEKK